MLRSILNVRHDADLLRGISKEASKKDIKNIVKDLKDTLGHFSLVEGVGLSAIQIGFTSRVFVIRENKEGDMTVVANPEITHIHKGPLGQVYEGCLSIPGVYGYVNRPTSVMMEFMDETGKEHKQNFTGLLATIALHEYDHLNGILFVDRSFNRDQRRDLKKKYRIEAKIVKDDYFYA